MSTAGGSLGRRPYGALSRQGGIHLKKLAAGCKAAISRSRAEMIAARTPSKRESA
jgi:hypothetical protein